jgi:hypothetical protein
MKNKIILYRPNEAAEHIEVRFENETIWLTLNQIASLFNKDKSVVSRHLRNIYREGELIEEETVAKNATVQNESGRTVRRTIDYYNLDAIISVGYRVNSKQGTQFRIWATSVLREYLLKGYALNQRVDRIENNLENLSKEVSKITLQLKTNELPTQGVFFNGQIFDAYELMSRIIRSAKKEIILIDNYIDESVLTHLHQINFKGTTTRLGKIQQPISTHQYSRIERKSRPFYHHRPNGIVSHWSFFERFGEEMVCIFKIRWKNY